MFIKEDFLLQSDLAKELYSHVKDLPIIDFHNHLSPKEIYENIPYQNLTDIWLDFDHYKWRLMRHSGINEAYITGSKSKFEKFQAYCVALENAFLNPLYHWSHLELKLYFGITDLITKQNAKKIYTKTNNILQNKKIGPRELLSMVDVETLCTTDDINDTLEYHKKIKKEGFAINVLPTFRPDSLTNKISSEDFMITLQKLEKNTGITINSLTALTDALSIRLDFFQENGCFIADHGLSELNYHSISKKDISSIFTKRIIDGSISNKDAEKLKIFILQYLIKEYARRDMTCQLHLGAIRNANLKMFDRLGKDSGFDSISDHEYINDLNLLLGDIIRNDNLPKIIIYNLNPRDNDAIAATCPNFSENVPGKIQFGAAWWFNDSFMGITNHLETYATFLNLNQFIGMITDSRSFLSFTRHDYFRRVLVNFIAHYVQKGHIPNGIDHLKEIVQNISYYNSKQYFNLK